MIFLFFQRIYRGSKLEANADITTFGRLINVIKEPILNILLRKAKVIKALVPHYFCSV